ncbi:MAG TPA: hypothetical protein VGI75_01450 [Pirellulales bacterium]|jgi:hypothetical protein
MVKLTVDSSLGGMLMGLQHSVELCDAGGQTLGWFQPAVTSENYEGLEPPFTREELQAASQETGGRLLKDILADLERMK